MLVKMAAIVLEKLHYKFQTEYWMNVALFQWIKGKFTRSKNQGDSSEVVAETCLTSPFIDRRAKKTSPRNFGLKEIQCKFLVWKWFKKGACLTCGNFTITFHSRSINYCYVIHCHVWQLMSLRVVMATYTPCKFVTDCDISKKQGVALQIMGGN